MSAYYEIRVSPIEPLLFTNSKTARAGNDHIIDDQDPPSHTLFGAIGTNIARKLAINDLHGQWDQLKPYLGNQLRDIRSGDPENSAELMGYYYVDGHNDEWYPAPLHFRKIRAGKTLRFDIPESITVEQNGEKSSISGTFAGRVRYGGLSASEKEDGSPFFVRRNLLMELLSGKLSGSIYPNDRDWQDGAGIFEAEKRLGIGMTANNTTGKGLLFIRPYRRFREQLSGGKWSTAGYKALYKTMEEIPGEKLSARKIAFLGGDRGRVKMDYAASRASGGPFLKSLYDAVEKVLATSNGFFAYLLTPAVKTNELPSIAGAKPFAAVVGKSRSVSGWQSFGEARPRPLINLMPAGSVFYFRWADTDGSARKDLLEKNWLLPLTDKNYSYGNAGYGRMLIGVWK